MLIRNADFLSVILILIFSIFTISMIERGSALEQSSSLESDMNNCYKQNLQKANATLHEALDSIKAGNSTEALVTLKNLANDELTLLLNNSDTIALIDSYNKNYSNSTINTSTDGVLAKLKNSESQSTASRKKIVENSDCPACCMVCFVTQEDKVCRACFYD